jgi:hypothetical protein
MQTDSVIEADLLRPRLDIGSVGHNYETERSGIACALRARLHDR